MRIRGIAPAATWIAAAAGTVGSVVLWTGVTPDIPPAAHALAPAPESPGSTDSTTLAAHARTLHEQNPFRIERRPSDVRFDPFEPVDTLLAGPEQRTSPRPSLALVGIVGGPPWNVLVDGLPGHPGGALFTLGDEFNGIRFEQIRGDTAVFSGLDTTWALTTNRTRQ